MMNKIEEDQINPADAKAIFKNAAALKKNKIDVNDLQKSWKEEGFPDDLRDISAILKDHGFGDKEIKKVYSQVIGGTEKNPDKPVGSQAVLKIVEYAKKNNIVEPLKAFLEKEYGEELGLKKKKGFFSRMFKEKLVTEEIRDIFTNIIHEERTERINLIKQMEYINLGRVRK